MNLWDRWKRTTVANQLMVALTAFIALATICNVGVAYFQWQVTNGSDKETKQLVNAANRQAEAVERGIDASNAYLAATRHLTEALNAAELNANAPEALQSDHPYSIYNNGLTAAEDVTIRLSYTVRHVPAGEAIRRFTKTYHLDRLQARSVYAKGFAFEMPGPADEQFARGEAITSKVAVNYNNGFGRHLESSSCKIFTWRKQGNGIQGSSNDCDVLLNDPDFGQVARAELRATFK